MGADMSVPGLLTAMNFVEDYDQEDKTVSPAEEAAAINSIVSTVKT